MRNTLLGAILVASSALAGNTCRADSPGEADPPADAEPTPQLQERDEPLVLRLSTRLDSAPPVAPAGALPVFLRSDMVDGVLSGEIVAHGEAEVRERGLSLMADRLDYLVPDERCTAEGHVVVTRGVDTVTGPSADFDLKNQSGTVDDADVEMGLAPGRARAARASAAQATFLDQEHQHLDQAAYTTCAKGDDAWFLTGSSVDLDDSTQVGVAHSARIVFQGVPLLYSPYMSFPLNDQRKSGLLAPTIGTTGTSGIDVAQPYYFDIAPNLDDTLTSRLMSKRGLQLSDEFRYLEPGMHGVLEGELLNHDLLDGGRRYEFSLNHWQDLPYGVHFEAHAQEISDSAYFRDLSTLVTATSTSYLPRTVAFNTARDGWYLSAQTVDFQTVQDPNNPVPDQFRMLPQITANYSGRWHGLALDMQNEYADFHQSSGTNVNTPNYGAVTPPYNTDGQRVVAYPSVALPLVRDWGYLTPKVGLHMTEYQITPLLPGYSEERLNRVVPISSLDAGLYFERALEYADKDMVQTLEPRLYFLSIPYRYQDNLPVFNTSLADLNYSQLFTENHYNGPDRINDASQLTAGIQSRLLDPATGVELARAVLGQRFYYRAQGVALPSSVETPRVDNVSDIIAGLTGRLSRTFQGEISTDFNPSSRQTEKFVFAGHWTPDWGKTLNFGYNIDRTGVNLGYNTTNNAAIRQIDLSGAWPVAGRWSLVGRLDYDTAQSILVEGLAGAEYTAGCWVFRVVGHRYAVSSTQTSSALFFQLELNGLARLGTNPLDVLRTNIPGYRKSNETNPLLNTQP